MIDPGAENLVMPGSRQGHPANRKPKHRQRGTIITVISLQGQKVYEAAQAITAGKKSTPSIASVTCPQAPIGCGYNPMQEYWFGK